MKRMKYLAKGLFFIVGLTVTAQSIGQVPYERILNAHEEPQNWLTYNGGYLSQRHSLLDQIGKENVENLELNLIVL